jgi:PKD repeat protein
MWPSITLNGGQPVGAIINKTNDLPVAIHLGTATNINITWFTSKWVSQEVNNYVAIGTKYGRIPAGEGIVNNLLFANMNGSYGPFNISQVTSLSSSPIITKNNTVLWQQLYRPIYSGKMNASSYLNIIWVLSTKTNWTAVSDANPPIITTIVKSDSEINISYIEGGALLMDINPVTGFPGYTFIPATSALGTNNGRALNYSYFDGTHWFYETVYDNATVGGMSTIKYADIGYNSSGYPYIAFVENCNGASSGTPNKYINIVKRLAANSWSTPVTLEGGVDTYPPSVAFDQQDGLHVAWYNDTMDDLKYYFEPLPSAVAGSAPVAAFSCTPVTGVMNLTDGPHFDTACTDASTETPTSYNWYIENATHAAGLSTSTVKNPIFNISFAGVYNISLLATNGAGSDWENKTHYVIVQNPNATVQYSIAPKYGNQSTTFTITDTSVCMNCTETAPSSWNTSFTQGLDSNVSILKNIAGKKFPHNPAADSILYYLNRTVNDSVLTMWENSTWFNHTSYLDSPTIYKNQTPTASFTADSYSGARPFTVTFTGVQANPVKINSWNYSVRWGANVTTDFTNPVWSTTFGDTGTWTVLLSVANWTLGNETYTKLAYITVTDPAPVPTAVPVPPENIKTEKGATWIRWTFNNTVNRTPDLINDALDIFVDGLLFSQNSSVNYTSITDLQPGEWHYIEYRLKNLTGNNYTYIAKTSTQTYEATLWQPLILIFLCFLIGFYIPYILIGATIISFWAMIMSFLQTQQSYVVLMYAFLFIISLLAIAFGMGRKQ